MGLKNDLYNAFVSNMSDAENEQIELTDFQKEKTNELAENLKEAFINFLVKQTFTIKEMKAILELETLKTTTTLQANVEDRVRIDAGINVSTAGTAAAQTGTTTSPGFINRNSGRDTGTQGGRMSALGYAYIGPLSPEGETNDRFDENKVQINREDIVDE